MVEDRENVWEEVDGKVKETSLEKVSQRIQTKTITKQSAQIFPQKLAAQIRMYHYHLKILAIYHSLPRWDLKQSCYPDFQLQHYRFS